MELKVICKQVIELSKKVGLYIEEQKKLLSTEHIVTKGINDYVTYVDEMSEQKLVEGLSKIIPDSGFIAEEKTSETKGEKFNWIIDPLDGTVNYIHGLNHSALSIALTDDDEIVLGLVYNPTSKECFYSYKGAKAYKNGREIKVSETKYLKDSLIATGLPFSNYSRLEPFMKSLEIFMKKTRGVRRFGSAALDLAYVACGRFDAFYEYNLNPWDVAAGAFIVQQAGGKLCDFNKTDNYIFGAEIVATTPAIFDEFFNEINGQFNKRKFLSYFKKP